MVENIDGYGCKGFEAWLVGKEEGEAEVVEETGKGGFAVRVGGET